MKILVTGANGFIGKNFLTHLKENNFDNVLTFNRNDDINKLSSLIKNVDWVFHLAGENRPKDVSGFQIGNVELTKLICNCIKKTKKKFH